MTVKKNYNKIKKSLKKDLKNKGSFYKDQYIDLLDDELRKKRKKKK